MVSPLGSAATFLSDGIPFCFPIRISTGLSSSARFVFPIVKSNPSHHRIYILLFIRINSIYTITEKGMLVCIPSVVSLVIVRDRFDESFPCIIRIEIL